MVLEHLSFSSSQRQEVLLLLLVVGTEQEHLPYLNRRFVSCCVQGMLH